MRAQQASSGGGGPVTSAQAQCRMAEVLADPTLPEEEDWEAAIMEVDLLLEEDLEMFQGDQEVLVGGVAAGVDVSHEEWLVVAHVLPAPLEVELQTPATFRTFSMPTYQTTASHPQVNVEQLRAQVTSLVDHLKWLTRPLVATYKERRILPIVDKFDCQDRHALMRSHFSETLSQLHDNRSPESFLILVPGIWRTARMLLKLLLKCRQQAP